MAVDRGSLRWMPGVTGLQVIVALALSVFGVEPAAGAVDAGRALQELSEADKACIACHGEPGPGAKTPGCAAASGAFDVRAFARSPHASIGCEGCHEDITLPAHPGNVKQSEDRCKFTQAKSESCRACHGRVSKAYGRSIHAVRQREGKVGMPVCADCHVAHAVTPASVQEGVKNACITCHDDTVELHAKWLPNAASHMQAVACSACHAPAALRRVDLRLQEGGKALTDSAGQVNFEKRARAADANADGLDAVELRALLAELAKAGHKVTLKGRVELRPGQDAHELSAKSTAIRECETCHDDNAAPFQSVTLSMLDAGGKPEFYDVHREVLGSAITWEALRGFYAIGGTRFKLLDYVLAIGLAFGIAVPLLHLALRRLLRRRKEEEGSRP